MFFSHQVFQNIVEKEDSLSGREGRAVSRVESDGDALGDDVRDGHDVAGESNQRPDERKHQLVRFVASR